MMVVNEQMYKIKNLVTVKKYNNFYSYIYNKKVELLSSNPKENTFIYKVGDENTQVILTEKNGILTSVECDCCNQKVTDISANIDCDKMIAVIVYHFCIREDENDFKGYKLTTRQLSQYKYFLKTGLFDRKLNTDAFITNAIKFKLEDVLGKIIKKHNKTFEAFIHKYFNFLSLYDFKFIIDVYCNNNIRITMDELLTILNSILEFKKDITEDFIMTYYDFITNMEIIKKNNPDLFDFTKQSIAFKMFLMMKGV